MISQLMGQQQVGRFEIRDFLGRGALGDVLLAWDGRSERLVALKVVRLKGCDVEMLEAERSGVALQAQLAQAAPQVAAVYETGEDDGFFWVAMEYVDGTDLSRVLAAGPLSERRAVAIALELVSMLEVCHEFAAEVGGRRILGIVHGDIKPENIRLQGEGDAERVRVLDFGIAKHLTQTRRFTVNRFGSLPYTPPERLERGVVDQHSDLWAVGVVLAAMVSGRSPFPGKSSEDLEEAIRRGVPCLPLPAGSSGELEWIVYKSLTFEARRRYQTAADLLADLAALRDGRTLPSMAAVGAQAAGAGVNALEAGGDIHATRRTVRPLSPEDAKQAERTRRTVRPVDLAGGETAAAGNVATGSLAATAGGVAAGAAGAAAGEGGAAAGMSGVALGTGGAATAARGSVTGQLGGWFESRPGDTRRTGGTPPEDGSGGTGRVPPPRILLVPDPPFGPAALGAPSLSALSAIPPAAGMPLAAAALPVGAILPASSAQPAAATLPGGATLPASAMPPATAPQPVGRRRSLRARFVRWVLVPLIVLALLAGAAVQLWAWNEAKELRQAMAEPHPDLPSIAQRYSQAASWSLLSPDLFGVGDDLLKTLSASADRILESYHGDDPTTTQRGWQTANQLLRTALQVAPRDRKLRARLVYTQAHLDRIESIVLRSNGGDRQKAADLSREAANEFSEASRLDPEWPDPYLGLARIHAYDLFDLEALQKALGELGRRGYKLGRRETAMLADGFRMRGLGEQGRAQRARGTAGESDLLKAAQTDLEQAVRYYGDIEGFADSASNRDETQEQLDAVEARQAQLEQQARIRPAGFWQRLGRALVHELAKPGNTGGGH